jgi:flagellar basal-body rod modification protein FlgD
LEKYTIKAEAKIDGNNTVLQTFVNAGVESVALGNSNKGIRV